MRTFVTLTTIGLLAFVRDRTALFFVIVFPLMFLVLFGGLFKDQEAPRTKVLQVGRVAVLDQLPAADRKELGDVLEVTKSSDLDDATRKVRKGDYDAAISQRGTRVVVHYSAADQVKGGTVRGVVDSLVQQANQAATGQPPRFSLASQRVEDESLQVIQFMTPGLLGWAIATSATFGAALTLVTWRQKKLLRRLRLAPVRTGSVVASRVGVTVVIALAQTAIFIGVGLIPYFGLQLSGAWWMAVPLVVMGTLAFMSLGLVAGAWAKTPEAASGIANLLVLPMAFLSGSFFPLDDAPGWLKTVSDVLPLKHLVEAMRDVMVRDASPLGALPTLGGLALFTVVVTVIATRLFSWDDA